MYVFMRFQRTFMLLWLLALGVAQSLAQANWPGLQSFVMRPSFNVPELSGPSRSCPGSGILFTCTNCYPDDQLNWQLEGPAQIEWAVANELWLHAGSPGKVVIRLKRKSIWGESSRTDTLTVLETPQISLGRDTALCPGASLLLNPPGGFARYQWEDGSETPRRSLSKPGSYRLRVEAAGGCTATAQIRILPLAPPVPDLGKEQFICKGGTLQLRPAYRYAAYQWSDGSTAPALRVSRPGIYAVTVSDHCGRSGADTVSVQTANAIALNLGPDRFVCQDDTFSLDAGAGFVSYRWQNGANTQKIRANKGGLFWVQAADPQGCSSRDTLRVEGEACQTPFKLPSGFSPDGDGVNDSFGPRAPEGAKGYSIQIMARNGLLVFAASNPATRWNGNAGPRPAPTGEYLYTLQYRDSAGKRQFETGALILSRKIAK